jgi:hypothetical protein
MRRDVTLLTLVVLSVAGIVWFGTSHEDEAPPPRADGRPRSQPPAQPRPRHREPAAVAAPSPDPALAPAPPPAEHPTPPAERLFLRGRTAKEVVAPFADVTRRPGRARFREDMVPAGAWTQLCDVVDEDFDHGVESFTKAFLASAERGGTALDADQRRRFEECEKAYWRVIVDLQQRSSALYDKLLAHDYRDDAERDALELQRARIGGVTDDLNHERAKAENEILKLPAR